MSNNKQSSIEWFAQKLYETLEIRGDGYVIDSLLDLAKAMHKEETIKLYYAYEDYVLREEGIIKTFGQFYNETFGGTEQ